MQRILLDWDADRRSSTRLARLLVVSFIAHAIFITFLLPRLTLSERTEKFHEIDLMTAQELAKIDAATKAQKMAETEDANNREEDPNAKFLGEHNQRAEKDKRAKTIDDFRKKSGAGSPAQAPADLRAVAPPSPSKTLQQQITEHAEPGEGPAEATAQSRPKAWRSLSMRDLSVPSVGGLSAATDDKLDGVEDSDRTVLSTREYRYYSYYHRIKELLRQHWKPRVEQKMLGLWTKGRQLKSDEVTTRVLVTLDSKGQIREIARVEGSGVSDLDDAATESFRLAAPFPNPPKGMIDPDGFVRIHWDFILRTESAPRIQFQGSRDARY